MGAHVPTGLGGDGHLGAGRLPHRHAQAEDDDDRRTGGNVGRVADPDNFAPDPDPDPV